MQGVWEGRLAGSHTGNSGENPFKTSLVNSNTSTLARLLTTCPKARLPDIHSSWRLDLDQSIKWTRKRLSSVYEVSRPNGPCRRGLCLAVYELAWKRRYWAVAATRCQSVSLMCLRTFVRSFDEEMPQKWASTTGSGNRPQTLERRDQSRSYGFWADEMFDVRLDPYRWTRHRLWLSSLVVGGITNVMSTMVDLTVQSGQWPFKGHSVKQIITLIELN